LAGLCDKPGSSHIRYIISVSSSQVSCAAKVALPPP